MSASQFPHRERIAFRCSSPPCPGGWRAAARRMAILFAGIAVTGLPACNGTSGMFAGSSPPAATSSPGMNTGFGIVQSVEVVPRADTGIGLGTVAGGVLGGVLGNQVGQGRGNTAATVAGVAGGALAGHEYDKSRQQQANAYRVTIRMRDGSVEMVTQAADPGVKAGDRARIVNGLVSRS